MSLAVQFCLLAGSEIADLSQAIKAALAVPSFYIKTGYSRNTAAPGKGSTTLAQKAGSDHVLYRLAKY